MTPVLVVLVLLLPLLDEGQEEVAVDSRRLRRPRLGMRESVPTELSSAARFLFLVIAILEMVDLNRILAQRILAKSERY